MANYYFGHLVDRSTASKPVATNKKNTKCLLFHAHRIFSKRARWKVDFCCHLRHYQIQWTAYLYGLRVQTTRIGCVVAVEGENQWFWGNTNCNNVTFFFFLVIKIVCFAFHALTTCLQLCWRKQKARLCKLVRVMSKLMLKGIQKCNGLVATKKNRNCLILLLFLETNILRTCTEHLKIVVTTGLWYLTKFIEPSNTNHHKRQCKLAYLLLLT